MQKISVISLLAGAACLLSLPSLAEATIYAKWDFSQESPIGYDLTMVSSTGVIQDSRFNNNLGSNSDVIPTAQGGYAYRINAPAAQIISVAPLTGLPTTEQSLWYIVNSNGWDLTNATMQTNNTTSTLLNFELSANADGSSPLASFILVGNRDTTSDPIQRISLQYWAQGGYIDTGLSFGLVQGDISFGIQYDLLASTATIWYNIDGAGWESVTSATLRNTDTPLVAKIVTQNRLASGTYIDISSITVSNQIPEPTTYVLILSGLALAAVAIKRRRSSRG